jgi:hypothetical protein
VKRYTDVTKAIRSNTPDIDTLNELLDAQVDIAEPLAVQIVIDRAHGLVHVNVNSVCVLRACRIAYLDVRED